MPAGYYDKHLAAERLWQVYEIAPPRVRQYLEVEIRHVLSRIEPGWNVLELGCGYGRVLAALTEKAGELWGIDTSLASLREAARQLPGSGRLHLACMDAAELAFRDGVFDVVVCIQNGISAFHVDQRRLLEESVRVTRPGGRLLFSTYAAGFWEHRLRWFELQAERGLVGPIDYDRTGNGVIVCTDGFTATTLSGAQFLDLAGGLGPIAELVEIDGSSLFCEIQV